MGGGRYSVGALAHFLKNRFYVGDVAYRGEIHAGEHEPILDRARFDAVQSRLAECALERHAHVADVARHSDGANFRRSRQPDDAQPFKQGRRSLSLLWSHALLQRRKDEAGGVARVPAAQVEATIVEAVRQSLRKNAPTEGHSDVSDREAIDRFVERIVISPKSIEIHLREPRAVEATETNRSSAAPHARDSDEIPQSRRRLSSPCRGMRRPSFQ